MCEKKRKYDKVYTKYGFIDNIVKSEVAPQFMVLLKI